MTVTSLINANADRIGDRNWKCKLTGRVGFLPQGVVQINPLILEFSDGLRDVFRLRDLELTHDEVTASMISGRSKPRQRLIARSSVQKQLQILEYMRQRSRPVSAPKATKDLGFNTQNFIWRQFERATLISLEEMELLRRIPVNPAKVGSGHKMLWEITEKGKEVGVGEGLIRAQRPND